MTASMPAAFVLKARAELPEPERCLRHLAEHLREDGQDLTEEGRTLIVTLPDVTGRMWCESDKLVVEATSKDAETAYFVRSWLHGAFQHLASDQPVRIDWEENWTSHGLPPSFSILTVQALGMISNGMKRITMSCPDVTRFDCSDALHIQVLVNFSAVSAAMGSTRPASIWRRYTVRSVDVSNSTIDVDIFQHGEGGPGASWASKLAVGDMVGVAGPSGGSIGKAARYLIAGDEAALPAIARIVEMLPADATGDVLIETSDSEDRVPFCLPRAMTLTWLERTKTARALDELIIEHIERVDPMGLCLWVGCETSAAGRIRKMVRAEARLRNIDQLIVGYWRRTSS